jgi:hypothetical protein
LINSVLYNPLMDSARELSCASPTVPIDASIPASIGLQAQLEATR